MTKLLIGVFKYKEEILFKIFDFGDVFYCEVCWDADWSQFDKLQRMAIGEAFKLPKQFKTIEELRQGTKYYTGDYKFIWEGYLYG